MSKGLRLIAIIAEAVLAAAFVTLLFLVIPFGAKASVFPLIVFYVVGGVIAGLFLLVAVFFFIRTRKRG